MNLRRLVSFLGLVAALASPFAPRAFASPIISPFATGLAAGAYSQDVAYPGTSAQSAFNGGYWNAGGKGTHWIQADLGAEFTLSEIRLALDVTPSTVTELWVYLSDGPIGWGYGGLTPAVHAVNWTVKYQQFQIDFAPVSGRYLELVLNSGASWTAIGSPAPAVAWDDPLGGPVGGSANGVPEPATLALVLPALLALGRARRAGRGISPSRAGRA